MSNQNNTPKDLDPRFAASVNPDRRKHTLEIPVEIDDRLAALADLSHKQGSSASKAAIIRAALAIGLPVMEKHPHLVEYVNRKLL